MGLYSSVLVDVTSLVPCDQNCRTDADRLMLANDNEALTRRAYAHMPTEVQSELARDQFIQVIIPLESYAYRHNWHTPVL